MSMHITVTIIKIQVKRKLVRRNNRDLLYSSSLEICSSSVIKELRFPHNTKLVSVVEAETVAFLLFSSNAARGLWVE